MKNRTPNYEHVPALIKTIAALEILRDRIEQLHQVSPNENALAEANDQVRYLTQILNDWK